MKKLLPVILLILGIIVLVGAFLFVRGTKKDSNEELIDQEEIAPEIPLEKRPLTTLTPSTDGHWLKLKIENIAIDAESLDYELLYQLPDGRTQGVPGTVKLGEELIERDLLLGSESSGKFRYDEGVKKGSLTLRFRNDKGKLVGKLTTEFNLQSDETVLSSVDGNFIYTLTKTPKSGYFVIMETFGLPKATDLGDKPYGVFTSLAKGLSGEVKVDGKASVYWFDGNEWVIVKDAKATDFGVFLGANE